MALMEMQARHTGRPVNLSDGVKSFGFVSEFWRQKLSTIQGEYRVDPPASQYHTPWEVVSQAVPGTLDLHLERQCVFCLSL